MEIFLWRGKRVFLIVVVEDFFFQPRPPLPFLDKRQQKSRNASHDISTLLKKVFLPIKVPMRHLSRKKTSSTELCFPEKKCFPPSDDFEQ